MKNNVVRISKNRAVYSVREIAHLLSLSRSTTYRLIGRGDIPATKIGGRWVMPKNRLHAWVDALPTASTDELQRELDRLPETPRESK